MAITSGFLGQIHHASDFAEFNYLSIGDGVTDSFGKMKVISNNSMIISVASGYAFADGYYLFSSEETELQISDANPLNPRYDTVLIQVDYLNREVTLVVSRGEPSSNPEKHTPVRNDSVYELVLAYIYVRANATQITAQDIEDTRGDLDLCGIIPLRTTMNDDLDKISGLSLDDVTTQLNQNTAEATRSVSYAESELSNMVDEVDSILTPIMYTIGKVYWSVSNLALNSRFLLCDGSTIPSQYTDLIELLDSSYLPNLCNTTNIAKAFICAINAS